VTFRIYSDYQGNKLFSKRIAAVVKGKPVLIKNTPE
jgi:hypothetical protein